MKRAPINFLLRETGGNVAMMFGLMMFVVLGGAGVAIDLQRANLARTAVHEAADAALLAAARYKAGHPSASDSELTDVARRVFDNATRDSAVAVGGFAVNFDAATDKFSLDVDATMKTMIMGALGAETMDVGALSEARLGDPPTLEVAMALDVTGSMNQKGKISALRNSAKDLIEALFESDEANVKVGVAPFAQYGNVGIANVGVSWLANPGGAFKGCVGSRDYPYNVRDDGYDLKKVPGLLGISCPDPLIPLTNDESALLDMIDSLDANGWTYIPAGLSLAWQLLTPNEPFAEGISFSDIKASKGVKALILMTDGENTRAPDYPTHNSVSQALADTLTKELCVNIKAQEISIYTIAFDVSDPTVKSILQNCATNASYYFDAKDSDELADAFAAIAASLRNISLSK